MIKSSYASKVKHFGATARDITNTEYLQLIKERLSRVIIENRSFDILIPQYDKPTTLFYCDPPYYGTENLYDTGGAFTKETHEKLRNTLQNISGKFILSYNNHEYIKELYNGFNIEEIERTNNLSRWQKDININPYKELIIKNY